MLFETDEGKRLLAKALTHYVYRNTEIENVHAENSVMNTQIYKKIYTIVEKQLNKVIKFDKYIMCFDEQKFLQNKEEYLKTLVPESEHQNVLEYFREIFFNMQFGTHWDLAKTDEEPTELDLTKYILSGEFKKFCDNKICLDDFAMEQINKDIHNKIYTLLIYGYFNEIIK